MIDLHCHLLDGTGCGPETFEESLEMCRLAIADGVHTIVATPRWNACADEPPLQFTECQRKLERLARETGGALALKLGFLMVFSPDLAALVDRYDSSITIAGGRHLLVSLPTLQIPAETEEVWRGIARRGFSILLAGPECSLDLRRHPERLEQWVEEGVKLQINAASVTGAHGREVQRFALQCVRKYESSSIISSNTHDASPRRSSTLGRAKEALSRTGNARSLRLLLSETPAVIIDAAEKRDEKKLPPPHPSNPFLSFFRSKKKLFSAS